MAIHFHQLRKQVGVTVEQLMQVCNVLRLNKGTSSKFSDAEARSVADRAKAMRANWDAQRESAAATRMNAFLESEAATSASGEHAAPKAVETTVQSSISNARRVSSGVGNDSPPATKKPDITLPAIPSPLLIGPSAGAKSSQGLLRRPFGPEESARTYSAIRIYALAKELNIGGKELAELATKAGITGKGSALASLDQGEVVKLKAFLASPSGQSALAAPRAVVDGKATPPSPVKSVRTLTPASVDKPVDPQTTAPPVAVIDKTSAPPPPPTAPVMATNTPQSPIPILASTTVSDPAPSQLKHFQQGEGWKRIHSRRLTPQAFREKFGLHFGPRLIRSLASWLPSKHLLLCGPPGSGKTELAKAIPSLLFPSSPRPYILATAHSAWSAFEIIGGSTLSNGTTLFVPGIFTETIGVSLDNSGETWLILDEINRADIDRAMGPMFTALEDFCLHVHLDSASGATTSLRIPSNFRVIATMNTSDKNHLFPMSNALKRRFAIVDVLPAAEIDEREVITARLKVFLQEESELTPLRIDSILAWPELVKVINALADLFANLRAQSHRPDANDVPELCVGTAAVLTVCKYVVASILSDGISPSMAGELIDEALMSALLPQFEDLSADELAAVEKVFADSMWDLPQCRHRLQHWQLRYRD